MECMFLYYLSPRNGSRLGSVNLRSRADRLP